MISFTLLFVLVISSICHLGSSTIVECDENADCLAAEATCVDRLCECPKTKVFSIDGTRCLDVSVGYESTCEEDPQCSWLMGKHTCKSGKCVCESGYRYYHGKCILSVGLGEKCTKSEECHVTNDLNAMICSSGLCDCNEGYYARGHYDCRPIAKADGDICAIDNDCQYEGGYCNVGKCATSGKSVTLTKTNAKSTTAEEAISTSWWSLREVGDACTSNTDCQDIANSYCSSITNQCMCERGYYLNKQQCVAELGLEGSCATNSDCSASAAICQDDTCVCPISHVHSDTLDKCVKVAVAPTFYCSNDLACQAMAGAKCVEINEIDEICECPYGTVLNKETNLCEKEDDGCDAYCTEDADCFSSIVNSVCNTSSGECGCPNNYRLEDDICLPNLGAACDHVNKQCMMENSECRRESTVSNICRCKSNYYQLDNQTCIEMVPIDGDCTMDIHCSSLNDYSECSHGKCKCMDNYMVLGGHCFAESLDVGAYCVNPLQCKGGEGSAIQCRNSICQCPATMEPTKDGLNCRPRSSSSSIYMHFSSISLIISMIAFYLFH